MRHIINDMPLYKLHSFVSVAIPIMIIADTERQTRAIVTACAGVILMKCVVGAGEIVFLT